MKSEMILVIGIVVCLCLCSCSSSDNSEPFSSPSQKADSSAGMEESSQIDTAGSSISFDGEVYRYNSIPDFPIPNMTPQKITYYKAMLGETTELLDTEQIEQAIMLLDEVEIINAPTKRAPVKWEEDGELHQVISFYQNADDEEPEYSFCFLVNSMYIQTNGTRSDVYPTPNWNNEGAYDETRINDRFRRLIDSWSEPDFPPSP